MSIQYYMKAWNGSAYVDWVVNDSPDLTGEFYPDGPASSLTNITINKKVPSKMVNRVRPLNSVDGTVFHVNSYDWLKPSRTSSDSDSATDPVAVPSLNSGLAIVRGTSDGSTPRDYASLYWDEAQGTFVFGFTGDELETLSSSKPIISGHLSITEGDEDGYLSVNQSTPPSTVGVIRLPNEQLVSSRNYDNDDNISMLKSDSSNRVVVGSVADSVYIPSNVRIDSHIDYGDPSASANSGFIRVPNTSTILTARNAADNGDLILLSTDATDDLLIGDGTLSNYVARVGDNYISFNDEIAEPTITQEVQVIGNGQNMFISSQESSGGYGGSLIINSGTGTLSDGYVDVRTGNETKIRVFNNPVPVVSDFTLLSSANPNSTLLFNEKLRFYDGGVGIDAIISYDESSTHTGNDFILKGQNSTTADGGELSLRSGTGSVDNGVVSIWSGDVTKLLIEDSVSKTTTYNNDFDFDRTVLSPKIEHEYDATATGVDFNIKAQTGDTTGGRLLIASGAGGTQAGDLHLMTGSVEGLVITEDGYGYTKSLKPGFMFGVSISEDSYGLDKVLLSQEDGTSTNYVGTEMWVSAQASLDGYGGNLVLSSGLGKVALTDDGSLILRIGHTNVELFTASAGVVTHQMLADEVQISGNLTVDGTTTTINSTVVDIADRVVHVNHSAGANDPVPANIAGLSVHRGAIAGTDRDHAGIIWDESDNGGMWKFVEINEGDDSTLNSTQSLLGEYFLAQTTAAVVELDIPTAGGFRALNNTLVLSSRNNASDADLNLISTNTSDQILYGDVNNAGQVFNTAISSTYDFNVNSILSIQLGNDSISIGATSPATTGNIRLEQPISVVSELVNVRNITDDDDLALLSVNGLDGINVGDENTAGIDLLSKDGYAINMNFNSGAITTFSSNVDRNIFNRGLRREVTHLSSDHTILDTDGYCFMAIDSSVSTLTITLPPAPNEGDVYEFKDTGSALTNNWIISGNGNTIDGNSTITISQSYVSMILTYAGGSINEWLAS